MSIFNWQIETGGTLPKSEGEYSPVCYPRTNKERDAAPGTYKGAASRGQDPAAASNLNKDGATNVPRQADGPLDYFQDGDGEGMRDGDEYGAVSEAKSGDEEGTYTQ